MKNNLESMVDGKNIIILGPSPHLVGTSIGEIINSYDLVCRINHVIPRGYEKDYGNRTDILFHSCGTRDIDHLSYRLDKYIDVTKNIKLVVCPTIKADHGWKDSCYENFDKINKYKLPWQGLSVKKYHDYNNIAGCELNGGQRAILMLLETNLKSLFITGLSFYKQGNTHDTCYYPGHVEKNWRSPTFNPWAGHNQEIQKNHFKIILKKFENVVMIDSYLANTLHIDYKNVFCLDDKQA